MILPDVLAHELKIIFCGTAASAISATHKAYYANPTNYFWRTLYFISLTPHQLKPADYLQVITYGMGLTDMAKLVSGNDHQLKHSDFDKQALETKIIHFQPQVLAFTSKRAASETLNLPTSSIAYGWQSRMINHTHLFVLPSPSGAARAYWDITYWQTLADTVMITNK